LICQADYYVREKGRLLKALTLKGFGLLLRCYFPKRKGEPLAVNNIFTGDDNIPEEKLVINYINVLFVRGYVEGNTL